MSFEIFFYSMIIRISLWIVSVLVKERESCGKRQTPNVIEVVGNTLIPLKRTHESRSWFDDIPWRLSAPWLSLPRFVDRLCPRHDHKPWLGRSRRWGQERKSVPHFLRVHWIRSSTATCSYLCGVASWKRAFTRIDRSSITPYRTPTVSSATSMCCAVLSLLILLTL